VAKVTASSRRGGNHGWELQVVNGGVAAVSDTTAREGDDVLERQRLFLISSFEPARLPDVLVSRLGLLDALTRGVRERSMTLISAPAGSGKTVLAADWRVRHPLPWPVAWLTVDEDSGRPGAFWGQVVQGIKHAGAPLDRAGRALSSSGVDASFMTELAADLLDLPEPFVLVVDGFDRIGSPAALDGIDFLVRHAWPKFRLVLCGRGEPALPLHRYRVADMMAEIEANVLAFSENEVSQMLAAHGLTISPAMAENVTVHTGGWAAGVRLVALSLQRSRKPRISGATAPTEVSPADLAAALGQSDAHSADYLRTELLATLPRDLRDVLVRVSLSDQLWPDLVEQLVDVRDGRAILADLARMGVLLETTQRGDGSYRLPEVLARTLRAQLRDQDPAEAARLHGICARWFALRGERLAAVRHATAADWTQAAGMIVEELLVTSLIDPLAIGRDGYAAVLNPMPAEIEGPNVAVVQAALAVARHDHTAAANRLHVGGRLIEPETSPVELVLSDAIVRLAFCADTGAYADALEAGTKAQTLLGQLSGSRASANPELDPLMNFYHGIALLGSGAEDAAIAALESALNALGSPSPAAAGSIHLQLRSLNLLAVLHATRGSLRRAKRLGLAGHRLAESLGPAGRPYLFGARLALAWIYFDRCEHTPARQWAAKAKASLGRNAEPLLAPMLLIVRARILRSQGYPTEARRLLDRLAADNQATPPWVRQCVELEKVDMRLALGGPAAVQILETVADQASSYVDAVCTPAALLDGRPATGHAGARFDLDVAPRIRIVAWLAKASAHVNTGDDRSASSAIQQALQIAGPERLRRPFIESTPRVRTLIRHRLSEAAITGWLDPTHPTSEQAVSGDTAQPAPAVAQTPFEALSTRETEVLRYIAEMLSTEEIAAAMFISVNTVRTHVRNILRKLAAPRRSDAVRRARELQLV
jgi:LuxR family maltose regulon positive regulatory protein